MEFLIDANIAYALLVTGLLLGLLALVTPGTGILELGAFLTLGLAGYGAYHLGINSWAIVILVLSIVPFLYAVRAPRWRLALLATSIVLAIGGSIFLFISETGWPAVNPIIATFVSLFYGGILYYGISRMVITLHTLPSHNRDALIGKIGETKSKVQDEGSIQVAGELWSARSEKSIPQGSAIKVIGREGFVLLVEKISS
jgi:membrane-bound serine protease (ClpP class)